MGCLILVTERCGFWLQIFYLLPFQRMTNGKSQWPNSKRPGLKRRGQDLCYLQFWSRSIWSLGFGAFIRNQNASARVFTCSVDTIWTWMILNLMRWFKPLFGMTTKRLVNWCADSIRLSRKWCGPTGRDELLKRIFAK